jgi:hypothetical protein
VDRALPSSWVAQGPFVLVADPTGRGAQVWVSNTNVPADASFTLPFKAGDRMTGLLFNAYGNGSVAGLKNIELVYQPGASNQVLGMGEYFGNPAPWGHVLFPGLQSTVLSGGSVLVRFDVTEAGFYIGLVTATFERPCPSGKD